MSFDLTAYDLTKVALNRDQIMQLLPHRHEMLQLDWIIQVDRERSLILGFRDLREVEFWTRGHFPGNPMYPGVLMVEAAAQMSVVGYKLFIPSLKDRLIAFGAIDEVKFRGIVRPKDRVILVCQGIQFSSRACKSKNWGFVNGGMVFEATILGVPIPGR
ncbi:MAG TPA: 3-hydroxyacyl-ACP dehydratase FabZ family protein [Planctomycetota bacterium]|nr:3-hydroxyacyl-ACP dehydratase FabZ family protein [Planctomycetota bacterium]